MAKIPRIPLDSPPSAAVGGSGTSPSVAAAPYHAAAAAVGGIADVLARDAARDAAELRAEEKKHEAALAEKKKVTDETEAGYLTARFDLGLGRIEAATQEAYATDPMRAPETFLEAAQKLAEDHVATASNPDVGLKVAQRTNERIAAAVGRLRPWGLKQQTRTAVNQLTETRLAVEQSVRGLSSPEAVKGLLDQRAAELKPAFDGVYGEKAGKETQDMVAAATLGWLAIANEKDPFAVGTALDPVTGILARNLDGEQLKRARSENKQAIKDARENLDFRLVQENVTGLHGLLTAFLGGGLNAEMLWAKEQELELKKKNLFDDARLDPEQRTRQQAEIQEQIASVQALRRIKSKQTPKDFDEDQGVAMNLYQRAAAIFKKGVETEKDVVDLWNFQRDLAFAVDDGKIRSSTAAAWYAKLSTEVPEAWEKDREKTWHVGLSGSWTFWKSQTEVEMGRSWLKDIFESGSGKKIPLKNQIETYKDYLLNVDRVMRSDSPNLTEADALELARKAYVRETGQYVQPRKK